jgi:cell division protein ZapA (FtsZ GTPase activity inhibitor)
MFWHSAFYYMATLKVLYCGSANKLKHKQVAATINAKIIDSQVNIYSVQNKNDANTPRFDLGGPKQCV